MSQRILYITSTRIGDAILHSGVLAHLVERYRDARFTIAAGPLAAPLFRAVPRLDEIIVMAKRKNGGHWLDLWRRTVKRSWDVVVDHRGSRTSWFLWAKTRRIAGRPRQDLHKVEEAARVLKLGPQDPVLWIDERARGEAAGFLPTAPGLSAPLICVAPGAGAPFKIWPAERFAALLQRLTGPHGALPGAMVAALGGPGEEALGERALRGLDRERAVNLAGRSDLLSTAALLEGARLYIGNDSGLTHLAAAAGAPTLALFGPTPDQLYRPWGPNAAVVRGEDAPPPSARGHLRHRTTSLMTALTVTDVEAAARDAVARTGDVAASSVGERHGRYF